MKPLFEVTRRFFNKTFINELKAAGIIIKDKLNGPFKPLTKIYYHFEDKFDFMYLIAILPENDSKVLSLVLTYNNEKVLISSTINELEFNFIEYPIKLYPDSAFKIADYNPIWTNASEWMVEVNKKNPLN